MARKYGFEMRLIAMTNTHHAAMKELVIGRSLSWMEDAPVVQESRSSLTPVKRRETKRDF
jgi:DNA adenine methylase